MCGINGLIFSKPNSSIATKLGAMNQLILHRGPDDDGMYIYDDKVAMGMRRLSIIDLEHGKQPIFNDKNTLAIVFNGEIYNYRELKAEQERKGWRFKTQSDTEVVLSLYETDGPGCLQKLNGMFAFSIHDQNENKVFIARDRFGEKPLYYYNSNDQFIWASELKSIINIQPHLKQIDTNALSLFFALTYIPAPHTIYKSVFKLLPGHYMIVDTGSMKVETQQYWDIRTNAQTHNTVSYAEAKATIRQLLFESVEKRMIADVPLGIFLSGGVDSTILAAIMSKVSNKKIKTFSVGYENKKYDESDRARLVAQHIGAEHHEYILDYNSLFNKIDQIVLNYDEPFADSSCLPTYYIAEKTAKEVKVALTGDGGDEVFGGYNKYMAIQYRKKYQQCLPAFIRKLIQRPFFLKTFLGTADTKSFRGKARKFITSLEGDLTTSHLNIIAMGFQQEELSKLFSDGAVNYKSLLAADLRGKYDQSADPLKLLRYIDKNISLEGDMLVKVDRASMLCSLECRAPFLDHRLMEYTYQLPDDFLIKGSNKKRLLKDVFADLLPPGFFNTQKSGFEIPVGQWFRKEMKNDLDQTLSKQSLEQHQLFNIDYVRELFDDHVSLKADHSWRLWTLFCFQKWYTQNFQHA